MNRQDAAPIAKVKALPKRRRASVVEVIREAPGAAGAARAQRLAERPAAIREVRRECSKLFPPDRNGDHPDPSDEHALPM